MSLSLTYQNVDKIYQSKKSSAAVHALKDVSFTINPGELFCLLGPSGCGKTTLLRSTAGLETISGGKILYGDVDMSIIPPYKRNIGMVFQSFALYPHMNLFENVAYGLRVRKLPNEEVKKKVEAVMELVGLQEELKRNPFPTALSGGQQQRVAIARALVYDPEILLLDEPLANLDAKLRRYMRAEIRRIQKATNITTIFVTHDQEEAMSICDLIVVMKDGILQQIGKPQEIYDEPDNLFVAKFLGTPQINVFEGALKEGKVFIGESPVLDAPSEEGYQDKKVSVAVRPEGFVVDENGPLECGFINREVMGRDTSVIATHPAFTGENIRAIIPSEEKIDAEDGKVRFSVKAAKVRIFDYETGERIKL